MGLPEIITILVAIVLGLMLSSLVLFASRRLRLRSEGSLLSDVLEFLGLLGRVVIAGLLFFVLGGLMGPFGLFWWIVAVYVLVEGMRNYRATQQIWVVVAADRVGRTFHALDAGD